MKEARNVLIAVGILLFILIGTGVAISRIANNRDAETENGSPDTSQEQNQDMAQDEGDESFLSRFFFSNRNGDEDTTEDTSEDGTSEDDDSMVIVSETEGDDTNGTVNTKDNGVTTTRDIAMKNTKGATTQKADLTTETKGGVAEQPESIPSTGTPTAVLALSALTFGAGYMLRKNS